MLLENNESTFEDLDKAYLALLAAKNGLVEKVDSDKTKLNELIERADKIDLSFYTKESAESFVIVLKQAKLIMKNKIVKKDCFKYKTI